LRILIQFFPLFSIVVFAHASAMLNEMTDALQLFILLGSFARVFHPSSGFAVKVVYVMGRTDGWMGMEWRGAFDQ
jgi:hypothetical protein